MAAVDFVPKVSVETPVPPVIWKGEGWPEFCDQLPASPFEEGPVFCGSQVRRTYTLPTQAFAAVKDLLTIGNCLGGEVRRTFCERRYDDRRDPNKN